MTNNCYSQNGFLSESTLIDNGSPSSYNSSVIVSQNDIGLNRIYHVGTISGATPQSFGASNGTNSGLNSVEYHYYLLVTDTIGNTIFASIFTVGIGTGSVELFSDNGNVYLFGSTTGNGLNTTNGTSFSGSSSGFVVAFLNGTINSNGSNFDFATYISGNGADEVTSIDGEGGSIWLGLKTSSTNLYVTNVSLNMGGDDIYVIGLDNGMINGNSGLSATSFASYIGGTNNEEPQDLLFDAGNLYITARSNSSNVQVTNTSFYPSLTSSWSGVIIKIGTNTLMSGSQLTATAGDYITYFGSNDNFDFKGECYVSNGKLVGTGNSTGVLPVSAGLNDGTNEVGFLMGLNLATMASNLNPAPVNGDYLSIVHEINSPAVQLKEYNGDFYIAGNTLSFNGDLMPSLTNNNQAMVGLNVYIQKVDQTTISSNSAINTSLNDWTQLFGCGGNPIMDQVIDVDDFGVHSCIHAGMDGSCLPVSYSVGYGLLQARSVYMNLCHDGYINYGMYLSQEKMVRSSVKGYNGAVYISGDIVQPFAPTLPIPTLTTSSFNWGVDEQELIHMKFKFNVDIAVTDTLFPDSQTVCEYATPDMIQGVDFNLPSDSLPLLYSNNVVHSQFLNSYATFHQWQQASTPIGPWTDIPIGILSDYQPVVGTTDMYYRRKTYSSSCGDLAVLSTSDVSAVLVNANVAPVADAGGVFNICPSTNIIIGGAPSATGGVAPYAYSWDLGLGNLANPIFNNTTDAIATLTVTDATGCVHSDQATINVHIANAGSDVSSCEGQNTQIGDFVPYLPEIGYSWSPSTDLSCDTCSSTLVNPVINTDYTLSLSVSITGGGACQTNDVVTVTTVPAPITPNFAGSDQIFCFGGTANLGTTEELGYNYTWFPTNYITSSNASTTIYDPGNLSFSPQPDPGIYTLQADTLGCSFVDQVIVYTIDAEAGIDGCGPRMVGTADVTPNIEETYSWTVVSGPGVITGATNLATTSVSASIGGTTIYELEVTFNGVTCMDQLIVPDCGCAQFLIDVNSPSGCPSIPLSGGPVYFTALIGNPNGLTFSWVPTIGLSGYDTQTVELLTSAETTYTVTVTDPNYPNFFCQQTIDVNLPAWSIPNTIMTDTVICLGDSTELVENYVVGYDYEWNINNSVLNPYVSPLPGLHDYPVLVTDQASGCFTLDTAYVYVHDKEALAGDDWYVCSNALVQLGANLDNSNVNFSWNPALSPWQNGTDQNSAQPQVLLTTTTQFVLTTQSSVGGCIDTDTVDVIVDNQPVLPTLMNETICLGDEVKIGPTSQNGIIYSWSPGSGLSCTNCAQPFASPNSTAAYTLTLDQLGNCSNTVSSVLTVTVTDPSFSLNDVTFCSSGTPISSAGSGSPSGYSTYFWSPPNLVSDPFIQLPNFIPEADTSEVYLTAVDLNGCSYTDTLLLIPQNNPPRAGSNVIICLNDGSIMLGNPENSGALTWSPSTDLSALTAPTTTFTPTFTGTYTYSLTSTVGTCILTDEIVIEVNDFDYPSINSTFLCEGGCGEIGIPYLGSNNFQWSPAQLVNDPSIANPVACPIQSTNFTVVITGQNGCQDVEIVSVILTDSLAPVVQTSPVDVCFDQPIYYMNPFVSPPNSDYEYSWTPGAGLNNSSLLNPEFSNLGIGTYQYYLTVLNQTSGCVSMDTAVVTITNCISVDTCTIPFQTNIMKDSICSGESLYVTFTSDSSNVSYAWLAIPNNIALDGSGELIDLTLTNSQNQLDSIIFQITPNLPECQGETQEVTVYLYPLEQPTLLGDTVYCAGDSALVYTSGGYDLYSWNNQNTGDSSTYATTMDNLLVLDIVDTNSCVYQLTATLFEQPIYHTLDTFSICQGDSLLIHGVFQSLGGTYLDTILVNGCDSISEVTLNLQPLPILTVSADTLDVCFGDEINFTAIGADAYSWNGVIGPANFQYTPLLSENFPIYGFSSFGCMDSTEFNIFVHPFGDSGFNFNSAIFCLTEVNPVPIITGDSSGYFTGSNGLIIDSLTGEINLVSSDTGTFVVTFNSGGPCPTFSDTTISILENIDPNFFFDESTYCLNAVNVVTSLNNLFVPNNFSVTPVGLSIETTTGEIDLENSISGVYTVTNVVSYLNCPTTSFDTLITIFDLPEASLLGDYVVCDSVMPIIDIDFEGSEPWIFSYQHTGVGVVYTDTISSTPYSIPNVDFGEYILLTIEDSLCSGVTFGSAQIVESIGPEVDSVFNFEICANEILMLPMFNSSNPNVIFEWTTIAVDVGQGLNGQGSILEFVATNESSESIISQIFVFATDTITGCSGPTITFSITVFPIPQLTFSEPVSGCPPLNLMLQDLVVENPDYCLWTISDTIFLDGCNAPLTMTTPGCYGVELLIVDSNNCANTIIGDDQICVEMVPLASFECNPESPTMTNNMVTFTQNSLYADSYVWSSSIFNTATGNSMEYAFPINDTATYLVCLTAESDFGCVDSTCKTITIGSSYEIYVPNTITPNGDSKNQNFIPVISGDLNFYELEIYNRWGERVFYSTDQYLPWDATYNNVPVQDGVYVWKLKVRTTEDNVPQALIGHVFVLR